MSYIKLRINSESYEILIWEFDPGSGETLAAHIRHASRTEVVTNGAKIYRSEVCNNGFSGGLVSNAWATCLLEGNNSEKSLLIPHDVYFSHERYTKGEIRLEMGSRLIS